jgi:UDP-N-acetylmuramate--alanine ligase
VRNAAAALAVSHQAGLPLPEAACALAEFQGAGRRFEVLGEVQGIAVIDDYAHHPSEIRATLSAARARYPGREIWAVWQPHTYSRTRALLEQFRAAFEEADHVLVTEIYAAREPVEQDFSALQVVGEMQHRDTRFLPGLDDAAAHLLAQLRTGDVLLVLSAGDADQIGRKVYAGLENHGDQR